MQIVRSNSYHPTDISRGMAAEYNKLRYIFYSKKLAIWPLFWNKSLVD